MEKQGCLLLLSLSAVLMSTQAAASSTEGLDTHSDLIQKIPTAILNDNSIEVRYLDVLDENFDGYYKPLQIRISKNETWGEWGTFCAVNREGKQVDYVAHAVCRQLEGTDKGQIGYVSREDLEGQHHGGILRCSLDASKAANCSYDDQRWCSDVAAVHCGEFGLEVRYMETEVSYINKPIEIRYNGGEWGSLCPLDRIQHRSRTADALCNMLEGTNRGRLVTFTGEVPENKTHHSVMLGCSRYQPEDIEQCRVYETYSNCSSDDCSMCEQSQMAALHCGDIRVKYVDPRPAPNNDLELVQVSHNGVWGAFCLDRVYWFMPWPGNVPRKNSTTWCNLPASPVEGLGSFDDDSLTQHKIRMSCPANARGLRECTLTRDDDCQPSDWAWMYCVNIDKFVAYLHGRFDSFTVSGMEQCMRPTGGSLYGIRRIPYCKGSQRLVLQRIMEEYRQEQAGGTAN